MPFAFVVLQLFCPLGQFDYIIKLMFSYIPKSYIFFEFVYFFLFLFDFPLDEVVIYPVEYDS